MNAEKGKVSFFSQLFEHEERYLSSYCIFSAPGKSLQNLDIICLVHR